MKFLIFAMKIPFPTNQFDGIQLWLLPNSIQLWFLPNIREKQIFVSRIFFLLSIHIMQFSRSFSEVCTPYNSYVQLWHVLLCAFRLIRKILSGWVGVLLGQ